MKILVREAVGRYLGPGGQWVERPEQAIAFESAEGAALAVKDSSNQSLTIVFSYNEPACELSVTAGTWQKASKESSPFLTL